jgi:hypothetical protein
MPLIVWFAEGNIVKCKESVLWWFDDVGVVDGEMFCSPWLHTLICLWVVID